MPKPDQAPKIGITTSDRKSQIAWAFDWFAVKRAGGRPVRISPNRPARFGELDGLIVGGGDDIGAEIYKGKVTLDVKVDPARDRLELSLLKKAEQRKLPVLGICRGAQMINVSRGGTLHADIVKPFAMKSNPRTVLPRKRVTVAPESRLFSITGVNWFRVNSLHRQAVKKLGKGLKISAYDRHKVPQAIEGTGERFLVGVQWHPEFLVFNWPQQRLFGAFMAAVKKRL